MKTRSLNRKLLLSCFNGRDAREAILGGARIIDCENPRTALGNIKPQDIMDIRDAVLEYQRDGEVQISTNIGEDQIIYRKMSGGLALEKTPYETIGKAAQAALGVSLAMGTTVHPVPILKVGLDGMNPDLSKSVLSEIVQTLRRSPVTSSTQVMAVFFAQDLLLWNQRKVLPEIQRALAGTGEIEPATEQDRDSFIFNSEKVKTSELFAQDKNYRQDCHNWNGRTNCDILQSMIDIAAESGAAAIMIDTSILSKAARICLVDTASEGFVDLNQFDRKDNLPLKGILKFQEIRFLAEYAHYRGLVLNVCGSMTSYQAQQIWAKIPQVDQLSARGGASVLMKNPFMQGSFGKDHRHERAISRHFVRGLVPPEQGGTVLLPESMSQGEAFQAVLQLQKELREVLKNQSQPEPKFLFSNDFQILAELSETGGLHECH
jgi:uncharacterized protein (UPF0264 family)